MRAFKSFATKMLFGIAATGIILTSTACAEEIPDEYFEEEETVFEEPEIFSDIIPEEELIQEDIEEEFLVGDEEPASQNIVASGNCGTPTWVLYDDGKLVISGTGNIESDPVIHQSYWFNYNVKKVAIESGITYVGENAFKNCSKIVEVELPEGITSIGFDAFAGCYNIKEMILPESVTDIGDAAFENCSNMTSCSLPSSLKTIGTSAFNFCRSLKSIKIPEGVTEISSGAFGWCSDLQSVYLPESLTYIQSSAFDYCSSLNEVYFDGSPKDWSWIQIDANNAALLQADIHFAKDNAPDSITLDKSNTTITNGDSGTLLATFDVSKEDYDNAIIESSNPSVVDVGEQYEQDKKRRCYYLNGIDYGTATITVSTADGAVLASCVVNVPSERTGLNDVRLSDYGLKMNVGDTYQLSYTYIPEDATITNAIWSSWDNTIASVDQNGVVTANGLGRTTITINLDGYERSCSVRVIEPVTSITLSQHEIKRDPFQNESGINITVKIAPDTIDLDDLIIEKSMDGEESVFWCEEYEHSITIYPQYPGTGVLTVKNQDGSISDSCKIDFRTSTVLNMSQNTMSLEKGSIDKLQAVLVPQSPYGGLRWESSNPNVVDVTSNGSVMAVGVGTATITATYYGGGDSGLSISATCEVTVKEKDQSQSGGSGSSGGDTYIISSGGIALDKYGLNLMVGESAMIKATAESGSYVDKWTSSSENIAVVDKNGKITAIAPGIAVITANGRKTTDYASCIVVVKEKIDESEQGQHGGNSDIDTVAVVLSEDALTLQRGESKTLSATVFPKNTSNNKTIWMSTDTEIASVDQKGKVTAKAAGTTSIAAIAPNTGAYAVCTVTVTAPASASTSTVKGITISKKSLSLRDMQIYHLSGYATMTDGSTKKVKWSSSNREVVKVNQKGAVTAIREGVAVITAKRGDKSVSCEVTVKPRIKLKSYTLNYSKKSIIVGGKFRLIAKTTNPENATIKTLTWKSSNRKIATVNKRGVVIGKKKGKVTITATSRDGSINRTCIVTVR